MHELSDAELEREIRGYFSPDAQAQAAEALERRFAELEEREAELTRREEALAEQERRYAEQERAREAARMRGSANGPRGQAMSKSRQAASCGSLPAGVEPGAGFAGSRRPLTR